MWAATTALPEQVQAAAAAELPALGDVRPAHVVVAGLGDSALAGEVARVAADGLTVPMCVVRDGRLPAFIGPRSLVLAVSWSGETPETLVVAESAALAGATVVAVTGSGRLAAVAADRGWAAVAAGSGLPAGRCALGAQAVTLLAVLERAGLAGGAVARAAAAGRHLAGRRDELTAPGAPPERTARRIGRTMVLVHGSPGGAAAAARHWAGAVNQNAKAPAFASTQPELCRNELAGWGQQGDVTRQVFTLVRLRHDDEDALTARRFDLTTDLLDEVLADVLEVRASGTDDLSRFLELALYGDLVSLHLAAAEGVDPGPTPVLEGLARQVGAG